ncbi:protein adenylyltransferase SelO, mitochondrial-like isoform X2 [Amphibalanus amphitrite]|nr:protein adenylyltransferase SelO, mitochondrial-like isoform X2 [Amphibalanus amphitrite]XP_043245164.1 protein adenylyltransferase SelO, mitochondrial-like isoform X2 [Amphibalanus amphitrite]
MCDEFESLVRDTLRWHQDTYRHFPLDPSRENSVRFMVRGALFSRVRPTPFRSAVRLAAASPAALRLLDLGPEIGANSHFVDIVAGNDAVPGVPSLAHRYGGHQFGFWAEQLGDGRAHLIGEYTNSGGERWELQLKGSGRTPYSRYGDGRAVVRSSVREFLCSEAMHYLGVPTSRAATLVISDDRVVRDAFYDGRPVAERAAVVLRLAPCWFRFGSFEMLATDGDTENLRLLADYVIQRHFGDIDLSAPDCYLQLLRRVAADTGRLIARWQWCGFAHGVMNTDNMSILSITIDYGPFGFLDAYEPDFVPNHSDDMGRYSYGNQERVGRWNIEKLGAALRPLLPAEQAGQLGTALDAYTEAFAAEWRAKFSARLGLPASAEAEQLARRLLTLMERTGADFTMTFRQLGDVTQEQLKDGQLPDDMWALRTAAETPGWKEWAAEYAAQLHADGVGEEQRRQQQRAANPRYVLRNWMAQRAIADAEKGEFAELQTLLAVLERPFDEQPDAEERGFAGRPPDWAARLMVSCSS